MPFQKGNKLAKGRSVGSKNKSTDVQKLELQQKGSFVSDLIIGIYYLKNSKLNLSKDYFLKAKKRNNRSFLDIYIADSLYNWSSLQDIDLEKATLNLNEFGSRFENLKKISKIIQNQHK